MSALSPDRWKLLSPYLDTGLSMSEEERASWLASLREQQATLAEQVESLLRQHRLLAEEGFLEEHSPPLPGALSAGQAVGVYTLVSEIGRGGMGSVWLARRNDGRFERQVAIKFLNLGLLGMGAEERFRREGSILAGLAHPNIAELLDAGVSASGQPYLVLEYIEGEHIDRYCNRHALDVPSRIRLFLEVLAAVFHAHQNLIVHRDIKPSNVLVRSDGQVKLLDFGIAKLLADEAGADETTLVTLTGARPMTPSYAAPEQLQGGAITTSTDVYALGVLLYELMTGQHPGGEGIQAPADLVRAVVDKEPLRPSVAVDPVGAGAATIERAEQRGSTPEKLRRVLRGDLDTIIIKALKKEPAERYASVGDLADDLRRYLRSQPISARPDTITYRATKFVRRHRVPVVLATLTVVATVAGAMTTLGQARTARAQRDFAFRQLVRAERVTALNELLLSDAAPQAKPLTPSELLEREEHIVEREHYEDAADHVEMLISIGGQYSNVEENVKARRVLEQAYQLSQHIDDSSTRAKAACELGWALIPSGDLARGEALFQQGVRALPEGPQFAPVRVRCYLDGAEIAYRNGNARESLLRTQSAQRALNESPVRSPVDEMNVLIALADAYGMAGQFRQSDRAFDGASALMTTLGYDDTQKAVKLFNDWGLMLGDAGRPLQSATVFRRAIEINRTDQTENEVLPTLLHNYSVALRELGKVSEAAGYSDRARQRALTVGNQILATQANLQRSRIYRDQHQYAETQAILQELEPQLRSMLPPGHYAFASFTSEKSLLAEVQGDLPGALQLASEALAIDERAVKAGGQGAAYLPVLLVRRSAIELKLGKQQEAASDAARAVDLLRSNMESGALSSTMGYACLALGRALQMQGRSEAARSAFKSAAVNLQDTLGADHPETRAALELATLAAHP